MLFFLELPLYPSTGASAHTHTQVNGLHAVNNLIRLNCMRRSQISRNLVHSVIEFFKIVYMTD